MWTYFRAIKLCFRKSADNVFIVRTLSLLQGSLMPRMIGPQLKSTYRQLHMQMTQLTACQTDCLTDSGYDEAFFLTNTTTHSDWLCFQHANWQMVWPTWMLLFSVFVFVCELKQRWFLNDCSLQSCKSQTDNIQKLTDSGMNEILINVFVCPTVWLDFYFWMSTRALYLKCLSFFAVHCFLLLLCLLHRIVCGTTKINPLPVSLLYWM